MISKLICSSAQTCIGEEGSAPDYRQTGVATSGFTTYIEEWEEEIGGRGANDRTANIFDGILTVFKCVRLSTVISLYCLHLIAAPSTAEKL